ncbi:MAG: hypothetical protein DI598_12930, partial [Pseudopedobacter saltans]
MIISFRAYFWEQFEFYMLRYFIGLLSLGLGLTSICSAQQKGEQKLFGVLKDSITLTPIANASLHNKSKSRSSFSNDDGLFQILSSSGDTVYYYAPGFMDGYYVVPMGKYRMDTVEIWLKPKIKQELPGVFVSTET